MAATPSAEENKALVRRFVEEVQNEKNYDVLQETHTNDYVLHGAPGVERELTGRDAFEAYYQRVHEAFPDLSVTIEAMIAADDLVAYRALYTGTHEAEFMGIPATGEEVSVDGNIFARIEGGKIAEIWGRLDTLGLMQQLGVVEAPGE